MSVPNHSHRLLKHWRKILPKYRTHCNPWERSDFDNVTISTDTLTSGLQSLQEAQRWKRKGLHWYRIMYPVRCFQRVLFGHDSTGPLIVGVYLLGWYLVLVNLYWQPLQIEYKLVMNRYLSFIHILPFQGDIPAQVAERRKYRQKLWEIQLEGQWIEFTDIPKVYDYQAVNTAHQQLQTAKTVWSLLPEIKEGLKVLDWPEGVQSKYWLFETALNTLHTDIQTSLELQPRAQAIQAALDSLKAVDVVIQKHPYSSFQIETLEEQLQISEPFVELVEAQFKRMGENDLQLKDVYPDFAFPYTEANVETLTQSISTQIELGARLDKWTIQAKEFNIFNKDNLPKRPFTIEDIENLEHSLKETVERRKEIKVLNRLLKRANQDTITLNDPTSWPNNIPELYKNRRNIPTISKWMTRAEKIGIDSGLTLLSNPTQIQNATRTIELNEQYETERHRILTRAKRIGWDLELPQHTLPLSEADTQELLTADTQLKEMEPLLASIKRIENRFGIDVERPFTKSEHDLYKSLYRFDADINAKNIKSWLIIAEDMQATRYKGGRFTAGCDVDPIYCPKDVQTSTVEVIPHAFEMMNRRFTKRLKSVLNHNGNFESRDAHQLRIKDILYHANQLSVLYGLSLCYTPVVNSGVLNQPKDFTLVEGCTGWRLPTSLEREYALKNGNGKHREESASLHITSDETLSYLGTSSNLYSIEYQVQYNDTNSFKIHNDEPNFQIYREHYQDVCTLSPSNYRRPYIECDTKVLCNEQNFPVFGRQCILIHSKGGIHDYEAEYVFFVRTLP